MRGDGFSDSELLGLLQRVNDEIREDRELFIGIREGCFNVYYIGSSMGRFKSPDKVWVSQKFLGENKEGEKRMSACDWLDSWKSIKEKTYCKKKERIYQQQMMLLTNECEENDYFAFDMEYNSRGSRLGCADVLLISRRPQKALDYRHRLVMLELKRGENALKTSGEGEGIVRVLNTKNEGIVFQPDDENAPQMLKLGSGIVGHCNNFFEFIGNPRYHKAGSKPVDQLRKEACNILEVYGALGRLPSDMEQLKMEAISEDVAFVVYAVGCGTSEKALMPRLRRVPGRVMVNVDENTIRHRKETVYLYTDPSDTAMAFRHDKVFAQENALTFSQNTEMLKTVLGYDKLFPEVKKMVNQQYEPKVTR